MQGEISGLRRLLASLLHTLEETTGLAHTVVLKKVENVVGEENGVRGVFQGSDETASFLTGREDAAKRVADYITKLHEGGISDKRH